MATSVYIFVCDGVCEIVREYVYVRELCECVCESA